MKKNKRLNITFSKFLAELKTVPVRYSSFIAIFIFLLFLPGQNYYQTLGLVKKESVLYELPFLMPTPNPYPLKTGTEEVPFLTAEAAILIDPDSQVVVYEKNSGEKLLPASTAKIMTAVVVLENYHENGVLTAWESISESSSDASLMGLKSGDRVTVKALLYGLLLNSGADSAETLSQNFPGGKKAFLDEMNKTAKRIHLFDTHFVNESGLDENDQYTTVLDLARLASYALKKPLFAKIVETSSFVAYDISGKKRYYLKNINRLLNELNGTVGIKTGYTMRAGECLVNMVERGGHRLLSVILKSQDRFGETTALIEWGFRNLTFTAYDSLGKRP